MYNGILSDMSDRKREELSSFLFSIACFVASVETDSLKNLLRVATLKLYPNSYLRSVVQTSSETPFKNTGIKKYAEAF